MNSRFAVLPLAAASALCLASASSWAQHAVTVPVEFVHISNPGMTPVSEGSVNVLRTSPSYNIVRVDGAMRSELSLGALVERSSNTSLSANREDPRLGLDLQWSTPTSQATLRGALREASTRTTEFDSTGLVTVDSTQRTVEIGADWSQDLTPLTRLIVGATRSEVSYETPSLVGYRENRATATIEQSLSENVRLLFEANHGRLYPDDLTLFSRGTRSSLLLGYEAALSSLWTVEAGSGRARTVSGARTNTSIGRMLLRYRGERLQSSLDWRREVAPSGSVGGYGRSDGLRWANTLALTTNTELDIAFAKSRSLEERGGSGRVASVILRSAMTQFWTVSLGYQDQRSSPADGPRARSKSVSIGFSYSHPDF